MDKHWGSFFAHCTLEEEPMEFLYIGAVKQVRFEKVSLGGLFPVGADGISEFGD
jgi:hypothetical protein